MCCAYIAFLNAQTQQGFTFTAFGGQGIMGFGFNDGVGLSNINQAVLQANGNQSTVGNTLISNVINQNPQISKSFDILLDRISDVNGTATGTLIIGDHLPGYENVTAQPKLARQFTGRWTVALDDMIVNGQSAQCLFPVSSLPNIQPGSLDVELDTGSSFPSMPPAIVDAIYSSIPGALRLPGSTLAEWLVPCNATTNVTFIFGWVVSVIVLCA